MAARNEGPCGLQRRADRGSEPHRHRRAGAVQRFYGHSFIADHTGELVQSFGEAAEGVIVHTLTWPKSNATAPNGAFSATAARTYTQGTLSERQGVN